MQLQLGEIAGILRASCGTPERVAAAYSIDSRTLEPGALFFALRGPRFDGHDFVGPAFERGAVGAVVERAFAERVVATGCSSQPPAWKLALIPVDDTTAALQNLGQAVRRRWNKQVIGVTGSAGKSTTKELIAALLATRFKVHKSPGNLNNQFGLPLALLALEPEHEVAVVEMGMSAAGEIAHLARLAEPEIGVVTNVAAAHLEFFDSVEAIACAKRELIDNLKAPATAVLNYDDERVRHFADGFQSRVITYGFGEGADLRASRLRLRNPDAGSRFWVTGRGISTELALPLLGRHNVENALAAIAVATLFEVSPEDLILALTGFQNLGQRAEILRLDDGVTVISDCYNSNPLAMEKMLETWAAWPNAWRRIVIAGEMLELGPRSPELHRGIGRKCAGHAADWVVGVQGDAQYLVEGAIEAGLDAARTRFFEKAEDAQVFCLTLLRPGDVALVKGSRGVHLERIVEFLQAELKEMAAGH